MRVINCECITNREHDNSHRDSTGVVERNLFSDRTRFEEDPQSDDQRSDSPEREEREARFVAQLFVCLKQVLHLLDGEIVLE